jgi:threonine/homoserine/homoserine lactone efflux protein
MSDDVKSLLVIAGCVLLLLSSGSILSPLVWPVGICMLIWSIGSAFESFAEADKAKANERAALIDHGSDRFVNETLYGPEEA